MKSDIILDLKDIVKIRVIDFCMADKPFTHADRLLDFNVFIYIVSGYMKIWECGKEYVIGEKHAFFLKKGLQHYGKAEIPEGTSWFYIHFYGGQEVENCRLLTDYGPSSMSGEFTEEDYNQYIQLPKLLKVNNARTIERKLDSLTQLCKSSNDFRMAYLSYGVMEVFFDLYIQERSRMKLDRSDIITRRIILFLENNITTRLNSSDISSHIGMNYNYLSSIFRKKAGMSIQEYHTKIRMNEAVRLLRSSNLNISEVGVKVGFSDPLYFSHVFKKVMGYSPSEYLKQVYFRI